MNNFKFRIDGRLAFLEFDQPDSKVNVLTEASMKELQEVIRSLGENGQYQDVKALIITSLKDGIFIAGADIKEIDNINTVEEAKEKSERGKAVLKELERLNILTLAVVNGACLGGGFELALSCKYRVASFSDKVLIGLPEVKLGIIPGFGGTQRLPRLCGLSRAVKMILSGQMVNAKNASRYGLVDRLFPETILVEESRKFVEQLLDGKIVIKRSVRKGLFETLLENTLPGRAVLFNQARKNVMKMTKGFYPAPLKAIELLKETAGGDIDKGFKLESEIFSRLAVTAVSKNLIRVFYLLEEYKKFPWTDSEVDIRKIRKCGVLGAGVMGGGISQLVSYKDIPVRIKDLNWEALKVSLKTAYGLFTYAMKKKKLKQHDVDFKFGLISPTVTYEGFRNCDIIIEAVVEDLNIKRSVFKDLGEIVSSEAIIASNTSTIPISKISEGMAHPDRAIGLHFFNPVHRMPLVEVIVSEKTNAETAATTIAFARKLGKTVIVVKDVPGFLINRILLAYLNEAGFLLEQGVSMERIDSLARKFGMPMGPVELIDEIGIDVGYKVSTLLQEAYGERMRMSQVLKKIKEKGLLGKKTKLGFYIHKGKKKIPNPDINQIIRHPSHKKPVDDEDVIKRLIYVMINEASHCLEEGVVKRPATVDLGMIMGTGFPPFRAGLLRYADSIGLDKIVKELKGYKEKYRSIRFDPSDMMATKAENNEKFYM